MGRRPTKNLNLPPRMRARESSSGRVFYYYDMGGRPRRELPLGPDFVEAVRKWTEYEGGDAIVTAAPTLETVFARYEREIIPTKRARTQRDNRGELKSLRKFFDPAPPLEVVKPLHVRQFLDWRGKAAKTRADREKALLSHAWNKAREWGYTDRENPCRGVEGFNLPGRDEYVEDAVYQALYDVGDVMVCDAMDLAYLAGQRVCDTLELSTASIVDGCLRLRQSKGGKRLRIAIEGQLATVLARIDARPAVQPKDAKVVRLRSPRLVRAESGQHLTYSGFAQRFQGVRAKAIAKALEAGKRDLAEAIARCQFRDLRAKAGTDKAEAGDSRDAQRLLGHASVTMTEHYIRNRKGDKVGPTR